MAEHSNMDIDEKIRCLDEKIKVPEIPDVQEIFEKAENKKSNVVPFKKYSKYIAAAAVVLIAISIPAVLGGAAEESLVHENFSKIKFSTLSDRTDSAEAETEMAAEEAESPAEPFPETPETEEEINDGANGEESVAVEDELRVKNALIEFIYASDIPEEYKEHSSSVSSSTADNPSIGGSDIAAEAPGFDDLSVIEEKLNKKRSIEIDIEKDSVSVRLFDNSVDDEIISMFWVEGSYENSGLEGENYIINLVKYVDIHDIENGDYLPMAGDAENGNYLIPEDSIIISDPLEKGFFSIVVEIDIATGEYKIYASLI